jgi:hypothetical protein
VFKTHLPEVEIVSLWELLAQNGLPAEAMPGDGRTLAIHDPCTARHEPAIQDAARQIVTQLGYTLEEFKFSRQKTVCCSYGGHMWLANPGVGHKVVDRRVAESPHDYVTYCAMCRDFFAGRGKSTFHLLDLIYEGPTALAGGVGPTYSQRHENRAHLKAKLLKELWGESMDDIQSYESIKLVIPPDIQLRLETRLILVEDLQKVIEYAERSGARLLNRKTGHYLAYYKPTTVTYWVEYSPQGDTFVIHNAYSHRMEVGGERHP